MSLLLHTWAPGVIDPTTMQLLVIDFGSTRTGRCDMYAVVNFTMTDTS